MIYHAGNIVINIAPDMAAFNKDGARSIMDQINKKPDSVVGFATGGTPVGVYKELAELNKSGRVDFRSVTSFNLDEYYPIKRDNPQSYYRFMAENLFDHVNIQPHKVNIPNGEAADVEEECASYERKIKAAGYLDFQVLGIGSNGHIGFNEPGGKFQGATHLVTLKESTVKDNARFFGDPSDVPRNAITMGIKTIMSAKKILLLATGSVKAKVIKEALFGDITPEVPASVLQLHTNLIALLDTEAAAEIMPILEGLS
ncbi:MAG: glucosamine-6-phosphate deaminase [Clostridiales bacterium]|nr:glucosamine-6-phosphate deaminase [Clostridiales bacterium]